MKTQKYFKLFANCIPVKGFTRSLICDIQRGNIFFIPNDLMEIITNHKTKNLKQIFNIYGKVNKKIIDDYFTFLIQNEYGFWCDSEDELDLFPDIDLTYYSPFEITNVIIDIDKNIGYDFNNLITQLELLGCVDVQIRCFSCQELSYIDNLLSNFTNKRVKSIELVLKYNENLNKQHYRELFDKHLRLSMLLLFGANRYEEINIIEGNSNIIFTTENIQNKTHCGVIHQAYFTSNISTFTESQHHNTCLNRKISIDVDGEIKNCPSMTKSYGNIKDTTLAEALAKEGFKDMWHIKKDQIKVCQDCEFRHICTDCRAYLQDPNDLYSKPAKCSYDPYTATWGAENPTNNTLYGQ
ncbi:MAG: grasp-with-spasm system SPASM domain peptide maturase [Bacteroidetes bacterium]|nr:MAG: grasp-with-spasm system SPASM domain peptide maturase [Bacteroidota bacterium]TAG87284.1 MAG: grasp-with-spasm system SPASM domain peptide maturase [Bacteroidota bacterium]